MSPVRRLATILVADVVGLMGVDEGCDAASLEGASGRSTQERVFSQCAHPDQIQRETPQPSAEQQRA
jgi:hypothetical protein